MSVLNAVLLGLAMGIVFGFLLEKSRVFEPAVILGQFQLRNFLMLRVFLAGVAMGLVVLATLTGFGLARLAPKATLPVADLAGGLILGAGITLAGGLLGALAFTYAEPTLAPWISAAGQGRLTLDMLLGVPFWASALVFAAVLALVLRAMESWRPWRAELGEAADGLLPPAAPAPPGAGRPLPAE
jgi:hypothetical protein